MPRVENRGANVEQWCQRTGNGSSTHDLCRYCADDLDSLQLLPRYHTDEPLGDEGWGGNIEHPPYEDDDYICFICDTTLTEEDNEP